MMRPISSRPVFLAAATADYTAARAVLQHLTEAGWACFFCDEALLRAGERGYRGRVDQELAGAGALVVVAGHGDRVESEWVRYAWRRFAEGKAGPVVTVMAEGLGAEDLPRRLRLGACLRFPEELDGLEAALSGQGPVRRRAGADRRWSRVAVWVTMVNLAILGVVLWLLRERVFGPRGGLAGNAEPAVEAGKSEPVDWSKASSGGEHEASQSAEGAGGVGEAGAEQEGASARRAAGNVSRADAAAEKMRIVIALLKPPRARALLRVTMGDGVDQSFAGIPPGRFVMGSPDSETGRQEDEAQREVEIAEGFWMARTECTVSLWRAVMGGPPEAAKDDLRPVLSVDWEELAGETDGFFARLNARGLLPAGWVFVLPREEQWEYACRAGAATPFHFGTALNGVQANCDGSLPYGTDEPGPYLKRTARVGSYAPNVWGLYDMHGNVWEWCADKVLRGGSCSFGAAQCRAANRETSDTVEDDSLGFRIAIVRG